MLLDGFGKAESGNLADGFYFTELIAPDDETVVGWELTCAEHFFQSGGFTEFQEPDALMIDPEIAPQGVRLTELVRRVFDRRAEIEARAKDPGG